MRVEFGPKDFDVDLADFRKYFSPVADAFGMNWRRAQSAHRFELRPLLGRSALSSSEPRTCLSDPADLLQSGRQSGNCRLL
jgi:hypothetical protein